MGSVGQHCFMIIILEMKTKAFSKTLHLGVEGGAIQVSILYNVE